MDFITWFDIIIIAVVIILGIKGIINGLIKEVFGLIGIICGVIIAVIALVGILTLVTNNSNDKAKSNDEDGVVDDLDAFRRKTKK